METALTWGDVFLRTKGAIFPIVMRVKIPIKMGRTKNKPSNWVITAGSNVLAISMLMDKYVVLTQDGTLCRLFFSSHDEFFSTFDPVA